MVSYLAVTGQRMEEWCETEATDDAFPPALQLGLVERDEKQTSALSEVLRAIASADSRHHGTIVEVDVATI